MIEKSLLPHYLLIIGLLISSTVVDTGSATAAPLKPPLQALRQPGYTLVVAERLDQAISERRIRLRVSERLRGDRDVADEIDLLVLDRDDAQLLPGVKYLLFYSDVKRVNFKPGTEARRPDQRQLVHIDGADPAVFVDSEQNRELLSMDHSSLEGKPEYRQTIMAGLARQDQELVDLWSAEMVLRPGTFNHLKDEEISTVSSVVDNPEVNPITRARLLLAALDKTPAYGDNWYIKSANSVLTDTPLEQLGKRAGSNQLVYAALLVAQLNPDASDSASISRWLRSSPPLAENAALALRAIDPQQERAAVVAAIEQSDTPEKTRQMLTGHLRRMDRMQEIKLKEENS